MPGSLQRREHCAKFVDSDTQTPHARVNFQVNGMPGRSGSRSRLLQNLDVPGFPDGGRQMQADDLACFLAPESRHQQNVRSDACLAQRDCLVQRGHTEPAGSLRLKGARAFDSAVAVGVCLYYGTHGHARAHMFLHRAEVLPQGGQ